MMDDVESGSKRPLKTRTDPLVAHDGLVEDVHSSDSDHEAEQTEISTAVHHFETERTRVKNLNEEFAVALSAKHDWASELDDSLCEALCPPIDNDDNDDNDMTAGVNKLSACVCGSCLKAERLGNMSVLYANR